MGEEVEAHRVGGERGRSPLGVNQKTESKRIKEKNLPMAVEGKSEGDKAGADKSETLKTQGHGRIKILYSSKNQKTTGGL